jgi:hypothetical protein
MTKKTLILYGTLYTLGEDMLWEGGEHQDSLNAVTEMINSKRSVAQGDPRSVVLMEVAKITGGRIVDNEQSDEATPAGTIY